MATPAMPGRSHHSAPKFDGTPTLLYLFFDEIDQLGRNCKLNDKQKVEWTVRYAPLDEIELWRAQPAVSSGSWDAFKQQIYALYPGSTGDRKYSIASLEALTESQTLKDIETSIQFGEYFRAFSKIATFLKENNRLTDREISSYFIRGFNSRFRNMVRSQLRTENPRHHPDDPFKLSDICSAALFVLSCANDNFATSHAAASEPAPIKREVYDQPPIVQQSSMAVLAQQLLKQLNIPYGTTNLSHTPNQEQSQNMTEFVSTNLLSAASSTNKFPYSWTNVPQHSANSMCAHSERKVGNAVTDTLPIKALASIERSQNEFRPANLTMNAASETNQNTQRSPSSSPDMQQEHINSIEVSRIANRLSGLGPDAEIMLSVREILSISPGVRQLIEDETSPADKRPRTVEAVNSLQTHENSRMNKNISTRTTGLASCGNRLIVSKNSEELQAIDVIIGNVKIEALLDDGSQIIAMRYDLWNKLGISLNLDDTMSMESANKSVDRTIGSLQDVKVNIGGYDFYLQIHVVNDAPYEIMLGRPFHTLTSASCKHFTDGSAQITVIDPNTEAVLTIPTRARHRPTNPIMHTATLGF